MTLPPIRGSAAGEPPAPPDPWSKRGQTEAAQDRLLLHLHERRVRLGLVDLPEAEAELRTAVLQSLTPEQFMRVVETEPAEAQERGIMALEAAWRRRHVLDQVWIDALSELDDRPLYRWRCSCGHVTGRDYFSAAEAEAGWQRHSEERGLPAGVPTPTTSDAGETQAEARECAGCGTLFVPELPRQKYHDSACRKRAWGNR